MVQDAGINWTHVFQALILFGLGAVWRGVSRFSARMDMMTQWRDDHEQRCNERHESHADATKEIKKSIEELRRTVLRVFARLASKTRGELG